LVILDSIVVIAELLFDLKILGLLSSSSASAPSSTKNNKAMITPATVKDGFIVPDVL
jgi:hypothetical protein